MASLPYPRFEKSTCNMPNAHFLVGSLVTAASPTRNTGKGFTVSKTSTGVFRVTFNKRQGRIVCATATLRQAAGSANFLKGPVNSNTNQYVEFRVENASGVATDPGTSDVIDFCIVLMHSNLTVA